MNGILLTFIFLWPNVLCAVFTDNNRIAMLSEMRNLHVTNFYLYIHI